MKKILPLIGALFFSGCVFHTHPLKEQIYRYRGDGEIRETSIASLLFRSPGFDLSFPLFDSKDEFSTSYRISHLPTTKYRESIIYLGFESSSDSESLKAKFKGKIRYIIELDSGDVLLDKNLVFEDATWSQSGNSYGLYDPSVSKFRFESSKTYLIRIQYSPEDKNPPFSHCYIYIKNGGYK
jgi:hypothetical protein